MLLLGCAVESIGERTTDNTRALHDASACAHGLPDSGARRMPTSEQGRGRLYQDKYARWCGRLGCALPLLLWLAVNVRIIAVCHCLVCVFLDLGCAGGCSPTWLASQHWCWACGTSRGSCKR